MDLTLIKKIFRHVRKIFNNIVLRPISLFLIKFGALDSFVLLKMDGGICSQMHFYLLGNLFLQKGYSVKYDLTWFERYGCDKNGNKILNFDLLKAFPYLTFSKASKLELVLYRPFYYFNDYFNNETKNNWMDKVPPIYLVGYFQTPVFLYDNFTKVFRVEMGGLDSDNTSLINTIKCKQNTVAVHVRRGDLAQYDSSYGNPVTNLYFINSINYIESKIGKCFFYFFSDDPTWVETELVKDLKMHDNYYVVRINDASQGYKDLFLIAACNHQITSKGTLGKYGSLLNNSSSKIVTIFDDDIERDKWQSQLKNGVFING